MFRIVKIRTKISKYNKRDTKNRPESEVVNEQCIVGIMVGVEGKLLPSYFLLILLITRAS